MRTAYREDPSGALERSEQRYLALVDLCGKAVVIESADRVVLANAAAGRLFAMKSFRELLGRRVGDLIPSVAAAGCGGQVPPGLSAHVIARADGVLLEVEIAAGACSFQGLDAVQMVLQASRPGDGAGKLEARTRPDARNRTLFRDRVAAAISARDGGAGMMAVMILAIDGFQLGDEADGRQAAQAALQELGARVIHGMRRDDAIACVDTNEYAILIEAPGEPELAALVAQRDLEAVTRAGSRSGDGPRATASIGIAVHSRRVHDADELIGNAHRALWAARKAGGNCFRFHSDELEATARRASGPRPETCTRLARLTPRERQVLDMLVDGKASKMIAHLLGTSARTIDVHRARVMAKMRADSLASLVTMVLEDGRGPGGGMRITRDAGGETP